MMQPQGTLVCTKKHGLPFLRQKETIMFKRRKARARVGLGVSGEEVTALTWGRENEGLGSVPGRRGPSGDTYGHACEGACGPGDCLREDSTDTRRKAHALRRMHHCLPGWSSGAPRCRPKPPRRLTLGIGSSCWLGGKE